MLPTHGYSPNQTLSAGRQQQCQARPPHAPAQRSSKALTGRPLHRQVRKRQLDPGADNAAEVHHHRRAVWLYRARAATAEIARSERECGAPSQETLRPPRRGQQRGHSARQKGFHASLARHRSAACSRAPLPALCRERLHKFARPPAGASDLRQRHPWCAVGRRGSPSRPERQSLCEAHRAVFVPSRFLNQSVGRAVGLWVA